MQPHGVLPVVVVLSNESAWPRKRNTEHEGTKAALGVAKSSFLV